MNKLSYADIVSSLALITALCALIWNIFRDLIADKVSIEFYVTFGEIGNIKNTETALFADAGSLLPAHKFNNPGTLVKIVNVGRKPIVVSSVGGMLKTGEEITMIVDGLPKMLHPYEIFSTISTIKQSFLKQIEKDNIKDLWVKDTKGKRWFLSSKGWARLKETAEYVTSNKHL